MDTFATCHMRFEVTQVATPVKHFLYSNLRFSPQDRVTKMKEKIENNRLNKKQKVRMKYGSGQYFDLRREQRIVLTFLIAQFTLKPSIAKRCNYQ